MLQYITQVVISLDTTFKLKEAAAKSEQQHCRPGNDGHGGHRAKRDAGNEAHCGREYGKLYPEQIGGEVVA